MSTRQKRNSRLGNLIVPLACILVTSYFIHHAFQGRLGIFAKADIEARTEQLTADLASAKIDREILETRVALLRSGTIEKDMLDEQVRFHLNLMHEDEILIQR